MPQRTCTAVCFAKNCVMLDQNASRVGSFAKTIETIIPLPFLRLGLTLGLTTGPMLKNTKLNSQMTPLTETSLLIGSHSYNATSNTNFANSQINMAAKRLR